MNSIVSQIIKSITSPTAREVAKEFSEGSLPTPIRVVEILNQVSPSDLYCYLTARFGPPNGLQSVLFRRDDSDNLIHWEWATRCQHGWMFFQGHNFRTEVIFRGEFPGEVFDSDTLASALKSDFSSHGKGMSAVRGKLEKWVEFVNPYIRIKMSIDTLKADLDSLDLELDADKAAKDSPFDTASSEEFSQSLRQYSRGTGLCFGIRAMLPVLAESFVNLILFVLMKPDLKADPRLMESVFREHIDIRISKMHLHCVGFVKAVDRQSEAYRDYQTIINQRNDLLHGNVDIKTLRFADIFFDGRIPVFPEYRSMWERSVGVWIAVTGLKQLETDIRKVDALIDHIFDCLRPEYAAQLRRMIEIRDLGYREDTKGVGVLFPDHLVDFRMGEPTEEA